MIALGQVRLRAFRGLSLFMPAIKQFWCTEDLHATGWGGGQLIALLPPVSRIFPHSIQNPWRNTKYPLC